jgi:translation elongation factor EF-G
VSVFPGNSVEESVDHVKALLESKFSIPHISDIFVKNDAINILVSKERLSPSALFGCRQVCLAGPLSEEPVRGVIFTVNACTLSTEHPGSETFAMAAACRGAMLAAPTRVAEPMLSLELQTEEIRPAQNMLATRRAEIFYSDLVEGSYSEYLIKAWIPASEAFKTGEKSKVSFSDELRSATHGKVVWRLAFSHWAVSRTSPFCVNGVAHKLVTQVRKRKGLSIGEKVVVDADKQRTLTRMK